MDRPAIERRRSGRAIEYDLYDCTAVFLFNFVVRMEFISSSQKLDIQDATVLVGPSMDILGWNPESHYMT